MEKYGRARQVKDDNKIWRVRIACWITEATDTDSEYVIIIAFPWLQTLRESASMLRHTYAYITCLVCLETRATVGIETRTTLYAIMHGNVKWHAIY